jgi:hypothetical protein
MRIFINELTGEYPRFVGDLQLLDPTWSETDPLAEGWADVEADDPPEEWLNNWIEIAPIKVDGKWKRAFEYVEPVSQPE